KGFGGGMISPASGFAANVACNSRKSGNLFAGNRYEPCGLQVIRGTQQVSKQLHFLKSAVQEAIFQFTPGVDSMFKAEAFSVPVFHQGPLGGYAAPVIAHLRTLHKQ